MKLHNNTLHECKDHDNRIWFLFCICEQTHAIYPQEIDKYLNYNLYIVLMTRYNAMFITIWYKFG